MCLSTALGKSLSMQRQFICNLLNICCKIFSVDMLIAYCQKLILALHRNNWKLNIKGCSFWQKCQMNTSTLPSLKPNFYSRVAIKHSPFLRCSKILHNFLTDATVHSPRKEFTGSKSMICKATGILCLSYCSLLSCPNLIALRNECNRVNINSCLFFSYTVLHVCLKHAAMVWPIPKKTDLIAIGKWWQLTHLYYHAKY